MTADEVLRKLHSLNMKISLEKGRVHIIPGTKSVDSDLRREFKLHEQEIWSILAGSQEHSEIFNQTGYQRAQKREPDTTLLYPLNKCIHEIFEEQVEKAPDAVAVLYGDASLNYRELNWRANRLAHHLQRLGVKPDSRVAICAERSMEMIVGLLAVLKAGGAYVPLDPAYPPDRLQFMLEDSAPVALLTQTHLTQRFGKISASVPTLDLTKASAWSNYLEINLDSASLGLMSDNLAYLIYTSGSTGTPKGVMVEHRQVCAQIRALQAEWQVCAKDRILQFASITFDVSVEETFMALLSGATLVLREHTLPASAYEFWHFIESKGATVVDLPVRLWSQLVEDWAVPIPSNVRVLVIGGEAVEPSALANWFARDGYRPTLWNAYGPTETTINATLQEIKADRSHWNSIGSPIANMQVYILDKQGVPASRGAGEIYIGGAGVARGYLNRPELTAERFLPDPFVSEVGARMYKTGDLGRWLSDGSIEFLGRNDFQVKIRGFRIELGEIETRLTQHPAVRQAGVIARGEFESEKRLVAYYVLDGGYNDRRDDDQQRMLKKEQVAEWATTYDAICSGWDSVEDPTFNIAGWNSSYTGQPIAVEEMREWVTSTAERIRLLQRKRVWEIGCGTGLLLFRIAPECSFYWGTDVSEVELNFVRQQLQRPGLQMPQVVLDCKAAHECGEAAGRETFDLIVINSVIQHFPDIDYLIKVLTIAAQALQPGGAIFVGDVRSYPLLETFHASVQLCQAPDSLTCDTLWKRVQRKMRQEAELVIAPEFFVGLPKHLSRISRVEIHLKRGKARNELTCFRYDVVLHVDEMVAEVECEWSDWNQDALSLSVLRQMLGETDLQAIGLQGVPNARLQHAVAAMRLLKSGRRPATAGTLRTELANAIPITLELEDLWELADEFGYAVEIRPSLSAIDNCDAVFFRKSLDGKPQRMIRFPGEAELAPALENCSTDPARQMLAAKLPSELRSWLAATLPEYMVPTAYVRLEQLPLTSHGKLDRKALPVPEDDSYAMREYEAPIGEIEAALAGIWAELLQVERIGRNDNFFELGGHSLLVVALMERMHQRGFKVDVRDLFSSPSLAGLAASLAEEIRRTAVPENRIPVGCAEIAPQMLSLIEMTPDEIERIVQRVPGGARNVQDIYPLAPLQEGILFHYLMGGEGDPYLLASQLSFESRARLDAYLEALQAVIDRHDILRTAVMWEGLREPVQVVWRKAPLRVEEVELDGAPGDLAEQMYSRFDPTRNRIDVREAPLMRAYAAYDEEKKRWLLLMLLHHLAGDHTTDDVIQEEIEAHLLGQERRLPAPLPFRNLVAQARFGVSREEHELFFRAMLKDVEEPTTPFGLQDVQGDGMEIEESRSMLDCNLSRQIRERARKMGVTAASLWHLAWGRVLAKLSGRKDVVFGTVLFGRVHGGAGADRVMGLFINTLPLRLTIGEQSVETGVQRAHKVLADLMHHEHAPLALAQRCSQVTSGPLFSALLNYYYKNRKTKEAVHACEGMKLLRLEERTNYPLLLAIEDLGEDFGLTVQVQAGIGAERICQYMSTVLAELMETLETAPATAVNRLEVLSQQERDQLLYEWNDKERKYVGEQTVVGLFELQVERNAETIAVEYEQQQISYGELNRRANRVAHFLRSLRIGPEDVVGICLERSLEMIVGLLGIVKAGAVYLPLDVDEPSERLAFMLEETRAQMVLTQERLASLFSDLPVETICLDSPPEHIIEFSEDNPPVVNLSDHAIYAMYTSGSTGKPKGTIALHRGVVRLVQASNYSFGTEDVVLQFAPLGFDASTLEIWASLLNGSRLAVFSSGLASLRELGRFINDRQITALWLTSGLFAQMVESELESLRSVRQLLVGGDVVSPVLAARIGAELEECTFINGYGPTEATTFTCCYSAKGFKNTGQSIPIGKPIMNTQVYVLDQDMEPVPAGVEGELYIGGDGLARGYLNRPDLTAERFLPNPFADYSTHGKSTSCESNIGGERLYRTGDQVRWLSDGNLEFLGRRDGQVKIRGFRIELGEIEAALRGHSGIGQSTVLVREDYSGHKQLIGYVVARAGQQRVDETELRQYLRKKLPGYMVPATIVEMAKLPLTMNGKLDKRELPAPEFFGNTESRGPRTPQEEVLCRLFEDVLGVERVGIDDNFFELGGHSLLAMRLVSRIRSILGVELTIRTLLDGPSVHQLVPHLKRGKAVYIPVRQQMRPERIPLSYGQQRLWFIDQLAGRSSQYNIPDMLRFSGELDVKALQRTLETIAERHESLRTRISQLEGEPVQIIDKAVKVEVQIEDLTALGEYDQQEHLKKTLEREWEEGFDLERGPLWRMRLLRMGEQENILLRTVHHIVWDEWSQEVFNREFRVLYGAFHEGRQNPLKALAVQYADYALWQREWLNEARIKEHLDYWKEQLAGIPEELELGRDWPRPAEQTFIGEQCRLSLGEELTAKIKKLSRQSQTTLYMTLLAGFTGLLEKYSGQEDIVVGSPVANRQDESLEELIGFFVNSLPMRVQVKEQCSFQYLLGDVKRMALEAYQHQDLPFERLVEELSPERRLNRTPIFQVTLTWHSALASSQPLEGIDVKMETPITGETRVRFDLELHAEEHDERIDLDWIHNKDLFDGWRVHQMAQRYVGLLEKMVAQPDMKLQEVCLLEEYERREIVEGFNVPRTDLPEQAIQELFEKQVDKTPDALALKCVETSLNYAGLNARANRLAHYLRKAGVNTETGVGVCLERSVEMIVAVLSILKAGGFYVPLDANYPAERLAFMIENAQVGVVVTETRLRDRLPVEVTQFVLTVCIDEDKEEIDKQSNENIGLRVDSNQLAYVMYTSGSTGQPKGVMISHRNVVRLVRSTNYVEFRPNLVIGHVSNVVFDASTFEIWGALLNGCELAIIPRFDVLALEFFRKQLKDLGVSTIFLTTALFQECVRSCPGIFNGMDQILFGGETCDPECVRRGVEEAGPREVVHVYGPTETTTFASSLTLKVFENGKAVPIGRPICNTEIYILDSELELVGLGLPGEICIGGLGLARGYVNHPELTAERFVPNPFSSQEGERLYRTGDRGRWFKNGLIEFLGRRDDQVKIRGHRIELGELEKALRQQRGVKEAVAVVWMKPDGDKQLVGYVIEEKGTTLGMDEVREGLRKKLPEYMVPTVVVLEKLPLTAHGKVDRGKLPKPEEVLEQRGREYMGPRNRVEAILAEVWANVLGLERVSVQENYFSLGGDSILSVRTIGRAREKGLEFSVQDLFEHQTIAELATVVRQENGKQEIVGLPFELMGEEVRGRLPEDIEDAYPLTRLQAGMLFHSDVAPGSRIYHIVIGWRVNLRYDAEKFRQAVNRLTRHEMLRTSIDMASFTEPLQLVHRHVDLNVVEQDWRMKTAAEQAVGLNDFIERESMTPFLWEKAPLLRIFLHWLSESEFQCSFSFHHAILDGWSDASLITELLQDYECLLTGEALGPRFVDVRYRDYVALERQATSSKESATFWKQMLEGYTVTPVPLKDWREAEKPAGEILRRIAISSGTQDRLRYMAREMGIPLKTVLLAAHLKALQVLNGQLDITTGVVMNGRPEVEGGEQVVGFFLNTVPFRLRVDHRGWKSLLRETFAAEQQILPHRRYPMMDLKVQLGRSALFETAFNYVHFHIHQKLERGQKGQTIIGEPSGCGQTSLGFFVNFEVSPETGELRGTVQCDTGIMSISAVERAAAYYQSILAQINEDEIGDVRPKEERAQIERWNRTDTEIDDACVHQLFERQTDKTPGAVAVVYKDTSVSYGELNRQANQLAHYLRELGVKPDTRVAICADRSPEMIVGLLGILKAGGAYVPLDPAYPVDRLKYMLQDSEPAVLLTHTSVQKQFSDFRKPMPIIEISANSRWRDRPELNLANNTIGLNATHLAYVIYTSGSTGTPKGVMGTHRGMLNRLQWMWEYFPFNHDDIGCAKTSLGFLDSFWEIFGFVLQGRPVVLIGNEAAKDPEQLIQQMEVNRVTRVVLVPTLLQAILDYGSSIASLLRHLRFWVASGEKLPSDLAYNFHKALPGARLFNLYGCSEVSADSTWHETNQTTGGTVSLGRPITNTQIYILDENQEPVPIGVVGEIYIGGAGVARGYLKRPELTASSFLPNPFRGRKGERMYRTRDLGRWQENGEIESFGRNDHQVKIRGFRIELGEIEARLAEHPSISEAVVLMRQDQPGDKRLVAYVSPKVGNGFVGAVDPEALSTHLSSYLPHYMVPAAYAVLERLPRTTTGKLDRKALPAPNTDAYVGRAYEEPLGEIEIMMARIWADVLKIDRVGRNDNFFQIGGHSLLIVKVANLLRQHGIVSTVADIFNHPTVKSFSAFVYGTSPSAPCHGAVCIQRGMQTPLFLVHDGYGDELYFSVLAQYLPQELPVYGLRSLSPGEPLLHTMHALAERMVNLIQEVQPEGPYRLAGWSFGGVLAYEIAQHLLDQGQTLEFLGLIDAFCPDGRDEENDHERTPAAILRELCKERRCEGPHGSSGTLALDEFERNMSFDQLFNHYRVLEILPENFEHLSSDEARLQCHNLGIYSLAMAAYRPRPISIPVHLFVANERPPELPTTTAALCWEHCVPTHLLDTHAVPGSHRSMMKLPQIRTLGQRLAEALAATLRGTAKSSSVSPAQVFVPAKQEE